MIECDSDNRRKYTFSSQLSTEEREAMLRAEMFSDEKNDSDMVDKILEVIAERENVKKNIQFSDTQKAREEFELFYRSLKEPLYPSGPIETPLADFCGQAPFSKVPRKQKTAWILLRITVAAAILAAVMAVPVFGYSSVLHMAAHWTAQQFGLRPGGSMPVEQIINVRQEDVPEKYAGFQAAMLENGIDTIAAPRYINEVPSMVPLFPML